MRWKKWANPFADISVASLDATREAAASGDVKAQYRLGRMYEEGHRTDRDDRESAQWYQRAADRGHAEAQFRLGRMYHDGQGLDRDDKKAVRWLRCAAEQGVAEARRYLETVENGAAVETGTWWRGQRRETRQTVPSPSPESAARRSKLFKLLPELAMAALLAMGLYHFYGAAAHNLSRAERGDGEAMFRVARMYDRGSNGMPKDAEQAAIWYRKAAEQGVGLAQYHLGMAYERGRGVPQDEKAALEWYRRSSRGFKESEKRYLVLEKRLREREREQLEQYDAKAQYERGRRHLHKDPKEALKWFQRAAEQGYAEAQFSIGLLQASHASGRAGLPDDSAQVARWYRLAAEQGHAEAQYHLALLYKWGQGVPKDEEEAREWLRRAAEQGHEPARRELKFLEHKNAARDDDASQIAQAKIRWAEAVDKARAKRRDAALIRKSAEQGEPDALFELGLLDEQEHPENVALSLRSFLDAAFRGHEGARERLAENSPTCVRVLETLKPEAERSRTDSQNLLAVLFQMGYCLPQSDEQAVLWYRKAAERGNATAQSNLALMYKDGWGLPRDEEQALAWYRKAAAQGDEKARKKVDEMERGRAKRGNAAKREWAALARAAARGGPEVWFRLAVWHELGRDGRQDYEEAARWYRRAAERGHANAQYQLAGLCERGWGLPRDEAQAREWLRRAAEQGHAGAKRRLAGEPKGLSERVAKYHREAELGDAEACYRLGWKYRDGEGAPQDDAQALVWFRKAAEQGHEGAQAKVKELERRAGR